MNSITNWIKNNAWGLGTLIVVAVLSFLAIEYFKKPGQLTVIEANVMDMNAMLPPKGALPVGIKRAEKTKIEGTITYTGTVQAYEDEDVYPRIAGRIEKMLVYPGDRVVKGQLLVQLDTDNSEYTSRLDAAKHLGDAKKHEAGMARKDFEQAKFEMKAAEEGEIAARNAVNDAQAKYDYWVPEIKRQEVLLKDDVVSKQEYDDELAKFKSANANLEKARAELRKATNSKLAAKAAFEKAVHHVGHEFSSSQQAIAVAKTANTIDKYRNIRASRNSVVIKRLISPGVLVEPGMLILKLAQIDKVRVQAEVSNTDIDRVHLGDKVLITRGKHSTEVVNGRITSIFPAADKSARTSIVEALIDNTLIGKSSSGKQVNSAKQYRFLPGQYVVMNIVTGSKVALTVPTEAIFYRDGKPHVWIAGSSGSRKLKEKYKCPMHPSETSNHPSDCPKCGMKLKLVEEKDIAKTGSNKPPLYTCSMHPEVQSKTPGKCPKCSMDLNPSEIRGAKLSRLVQIKTGLANPDLTEVKEGVSLGDEIIFTGYSELQPQVPVVGVKWTSSGIEKLPLASEVAGNRLAAGNKWSLNKVVDQIKVRVSVEPSPPISKNNSIVLLLEKQDGSKYTNATVTGESSMPSMDMKGPNLSAENKGDGKYRIKSDFHSGLWQLNLVVNGAGKSSSRLVIDLEVP